MNMEKEARVTAAFAEKQRANGKQKDLQSQKQRAEKYRK